ncbi:MAG: Rne/Rng family ribonuclease [Bacteroidia bacterium]
MYAKSRSLIITKEDHEIRICLLENGRLTEYYQEPLVKRYGLGDIFLGEVTRIQPSLNAAFVDIGLEKEGFLHHTDMGLGAQTHLNYLRTLRTQPQNLRPLEDIPPAPPLQKNASIEQLLKPGDWILAQVSKEMTDTKGPRLTAQISLAGNYLVLIPFENEIGISTRTPQIEQREALRYKLTPLLIPNHGFIVRTAGIQQPLPVLQQEYDSLLQTWKKILARLKTLRPPARLSSDIPKPIAMLRDTLALGIDTIYTDSPEIYEQIKAYFQENHIPLPSLNLHKKRIPLLSYLGLDREIKQSLGKTVSLPNGSYIIIEKTEALHVIDVNSGSHLEKPSEEAILEVNLQAATEIARQIRLRDLGGIIAIDFIDQRQAAHRQLIYEKLKKHMEADRTRHNILPMNEFGIIHITRQRKRAPLTLPEKNIPCPVCQGRGVLSDTFDWEIRFFKTVSYLHEKYPRSLIGVQVTSFFFRSLGQGKNWMYHQHRWLWIEPCKDLPWGTAIFYDLSSQKILIRL